MSHANLRKGNGQLLAFIVYLTVQYEVKFMQEHPMSSWFYFFPLCSQAPCHMSI